MRVALRADASAAVGFGHFARCLALAEALVARGHETALVSAELTPSLADYARRVPATVLPLDRFDAARDDAAATLDAIRKWGGADHIVVDHYLLDASWESEVGDNAIVTAIDDLRRGHLANLVVDANCGVRGAQYAGRVPSDTWVLAGPRYALLRREFASVPPRQRHVLNRVLVSYGGADPAGSVLVALDALQSLPGLQVDVVVGSGSACVAEVRRRAAGAGNFAVHVDSSNMAALMSAADLALGAPGVSALECSALGLPSLLTVVADNQREGGEALADAGCSVLLGRADEVDPVQIRAAVAGLRACPDLLRRMSARGMQAVDTRGASRVAAAMESFEIEFRRASHADADALFRWRNDPRTRAFAASSAPLDWNMHCRWLESRLADPERCDLIIGRDHEGDLGVLRLDVDRDRGTISVYLVPARQGQGRGAALLRAGERWLRRNRPHLRGVDAVVLQGNSASRRVFSEAGYALASEDWHLDLRIAEPSHSGTP